MRFRILTAVLLAGLFAFTSVAQAGLPSTKVTFDNGFQAIFVENHASPMITSVVFVNAGARYENEYNNGFTHFLEHLCFDGTKTHSQEQLTEMIEKNGGYINAFTRKDLTAFLVLMPTQFIDQGLDAQSDQLFNSIIPEDRMAKERKIVIEEIRQNDDDPNYPVEKYHDAMVYAGTPYARPVLGYENLINSVSREEVLKYYQTWYAPNNMIALVIGDFNTQDFIKKYKQYFGAAAQRPIPQIPSFKVSVPVGKKVMRAELETKGNHIDLASNAPLYSDPDYYAFYVLNEMLNADGTSPLLKALTGEKNSLAQSVSTSIETQKDFCIFNVSVATDSVGNIDPILALVNQTFEKTLQSWEPQQSDIDAVVVSAKTKEIYLKEKLHYYGFMIAPLMVATGYDFVDHLNDNLAKVKPADVKRVSGKYFKNFNYVATVVTPPMATKTEQVTQIKSKYLDRTMANGLEVLIKSNPYSEVEAFMVLGKDRSASEPDGKEGITDFVNRMLARGTTKYSKDDISKKLGAIGADLTVCDDPSIPYDDIYTTRTYSFLKFETIKDFLDQGVDLLSEIVKHPTFPDNEVEQVRGDMMSVLGMKTGSTSQQARDGYFNLLFKGSALTHPETGTMASIKSITEADIKDYHKKYYAPNNLILSVCTDQDPEMMYQKLEKAFGDMQKAELTKGSVAQVAITGEVATNVPLEKKQAYLYLGGKACAASDPDAVPLRVAVEILSKRLHDILREQMGLAYRVGAGISLNHDYGWLTLTMGTGVDNYAKAKAGMLHQMDSLKMVDVTTDEIDRAVNSLWGSMLTSRLSRINQAYYMAVNQFNVGKYDVEDDLISALKKVNKDDIKRVAAKYFDTKNYVLATVGAPK